VKYSMRGVVERSGIAECYIGLKTTPRVLYFMHSMNEYSALTGLKNFRKR